MIPHSLLDLSPIVAGGTASQSLDLAHHAETWGYTRYRLGGDHNMPGIASAATPVVTAHGSQAGQPG